MGDACDVLSGCDCRGHPARRKWGPDWRGRVRGAEPAAPAGPGVGPPGQLRQRQVAFLHRLREADPRYQTIDKAVLNAQNELGVILDRRVELEAVQP